MQELLAPTSVDFYSWKGERLGTKASLEAIIHEITGIEKRALKGERLSEFSIEERMSWAGNRKTKEEEDEVYALLGIFDVSMVLNYGEGREKAMRRLQEEINKSHNGKWFRT